MRLLLAGLLTVCLLSALTHTAPFLSSSSPIQTTSVVLSPPPTHPSPYFNYSLPFATTHQRLALSLRDMQWMGPTNQEGPNGWKAQLEYQMHVVYLVVKVNQGRCRWNLEFSLLAVDPGKNMVTISEQKRWQKQLSCGHQDCDIILDGPIKLSDSPKLINILPQIKPIILLNGLTFDQSEDWRYSRVVTLDLQVVDYDSKKIRMRHRPQGVSFFYYSILVFRVEQLLRESISINLMPLNYLQEEQNLVQDNEQILSFMTRLSLTSANYHKPTQQIQESPTPDTYNQDEPSFLTTPHKKIILLSIDCEAYWSIPRSVCQPTCLSSLTISNRSLCLDSPRLLADCAVGYYTSPTGTCIMCPTTCLSCQYSPTPTPARVNCLSCRSNFILKVTTSTVCACQSNQYIDSVNVVCLPCPSGCATCTSASTCTSCLSGFYLASGACLACMPVCATCSSGSTCSTCINNLVISGSICTCSAGRFLSPGNLTCNNCIAYVSNCLTCGYNPAFSASAPTPVVCVTAGTGFFVQANGTTSACGANCVTCSSATVCTTCSASYTVIVGTCVSTCSLDISGCETCISTTQCSLCQTGYYPSSAYPAASCLSCPSPCASCSSTSTCDSCNTPYILSGSLCLCPPPTYFEPTLTTCVPCSTAISQCMACASTIPTTCDICSPGFYISLDGQTCMPCPLNCATCDSTGCIACNPGYVLDGSGCSCDAACQNCLAITGGTCSVCTDPSTCQACAAGYYLSGSTCLPCMAGCLTCADSTTCMSCASPFVLDASSQCVCNNTAGQYLTLDSSTCSPCSLVIDQCNSCSASPQTICSNCSLGFYFDTANNVCAPCFSHCIDCSNGSSCNTCHPLTFLNGTSCDPNCSVVVGCATCSIAGAVVQCNICNSGYSLASGQCLVICGDSIVGGSQTCDDGNTISGDGCSSVCQIEAGFFCSGAPSSCSPCLQHCIECLDSSSCVTCNSFTAWDSGTNQCLSNCSYIAFCLTCTISASLSGQYLQCLTCSGGYSVDLASNSCRPVCGDGIIAPEQACDDGNLNNGDGCNSGCSVQSHFACAVSSTTGMSICVLNQLTLEATQLNKKPGQNSAQLVLKPYPEALPLFQNVDWSSIIQVSNPNVVVTNVRYDPDTARIIIDFDYLSTLDPASVDITFDSQNSTDLSAVTPFKVSAPYASTNNAALVYYQDSDYTIANIVKYLSIGVGVLAVLFTIAGLFGGRLIGLECSGVIQLTFMCLLTLENLSPSLQNLGFLSYSFGYNRLKTYDMEQSIDRPYKSSQLSAQYVYNYNIMAVIVLIPAVVAIICRIAASKADQEEDRSKWMRRAKWAIGEYSLYIFLSFSYLAYLSFYIQIKYLTGDIFDYFGLFLGVLFLLVTAAFAVLYFLTSYSQFFIEFKQKFRKQIFCDQRFYLFIMTERLISPAFLVVLSSKPYGVAPIIVIYAGLAVLLVFVKPYKGCRKNYRPMANYIITIIIAGIFMGIGLQGDPEGTLSKYGPLVIIILLLICIIYSAYALLKELRKKCKDSEIEQEEKDDKKVFETEMKQYKNNLMVNHKNSLISQSPLLSLRQNSFTTEGPSEMSSNSREESPEGLHRSQLRKNIHEELTALKEKASLLVKNEQIGESIKEDGEEERDRVMLKDMRQLEAERFQQIIESYQQQL